MLRVRVPPRCRPSEAQCATLGVLAPLVGMVGSMQAAEAMRLLVGHDGGADNQLRLLHAGSLRLEAITLAQRGDCPVCQAAGA